MIIGFIMAAIISAGSQAAPQRASSSTSLEQSVLSAFFDICPAVVAGEIALSDAEAVKKLGFNIAPASAASGGEHPRFGKQYLITKDVPSGKVAVAGYDKAMCQVMFSGASREKARDAIKSKLVTLGFSPDAENGGQKGAVLVDAFKKVVEAGTVTHVQLVTTPASGPEPMIIAQAVVLDAGETAKTVP